MGIEAPMTACSRAAGAREPVLSWRAGASERCAVSDGLSVPPFLLISNMVYPQGEVI
jgi:hypothetical protein